MDLIERLTRSRRPLGAVANDLRRADGALVAAYQHYTGTCSNPSDEGAAAALADLAVLAILSIHDLSLDTAGHLSAAADRCDPDGRATHFRPADTDGAIWRAVGPAAYVAPVGTPAPTAADRAAADAAYQRARAAASAVLVNDDDDLSPADAAYAHHARELPPSSALPPPVGMGGCA